MFTGRWFSAIEYMIRGAFWGVGYFFGFTLVTMMSVGMVFAEEFESVIRGRQKRHRFWVFVRDGNLYLIAEAVSLLGWFFLATVVWLFAYWSTFV